MFGSISGIHCQWPDKDRLRCNNELVETQGPKTSFGIGILSSSPFVETRLWRFAATFFCLPKGLSIVAGTAILLCADTASATPSFIQGNYAVPQTSQTALTLPYTAAQAAGDLNVVVVGWNDTTAQISSVTDTAGNLYQLAVGPTLLSGTASQSIFLAKNIVSAAGGTNTVNVNFSTAAFYPDVRILEYSGIDPNNPVDVSAGATGNSATTSSGNATTTNPTDLLLGANFVATVTTGPGSGFTTRLLTTPDADIVEDSLVTTTGTYSATAPLDSQGWWVAQMVALRVAGTSTAPTPTPTPTPAPTPTPTRSVTLAWDANPATSDSGTNTVGYRLHLGTASGNYTQTIDVGSVTTVTVASLTSGTTYYFVVAAYNAAGVEGPYSNQVSYQVP
jgi:hypothetical protein